MPHGAYFLYHFLFLTGLPFICTNCTQNIVCRLKAEKDVCGIYRQDYGAPIPSYTVSRTCGKDGPIVTEDTTFFKVIAAFNREKIHARIVGFKGAGAHGYFEVTDDITEYTKAAVFSQVGQKTPVFCRFAKTSGADTIRGPTSFSVKFYTTDGNWDLLSLGNDPIFILRDPILFPSLGHSGINPATGREDANTKWDFFTMRQETLSGLLYFWSDGLTPYSYRQVNGHAVHAFVFVNKQNEHIYVKFNWKTNQGIRNFTADEAQTMAGQNPDWLTQDLYDNIESGNYPSWTLCIQLMTLEQAKHVNFNPFDPSTLWSEEEFPCRNVGRLVLNKNPGNYFEEVEQVAFCPSHLVTGIQPSQDRVLQARLLVYDDAQRYRLRENRHQLLINKPRGVPCCPQSITRDGFMNFYDQPGEPDYYPNLFSHLHPDPSAEFRQYRTDGIVARHDPGDHADYEQARYIYGNFSGRDKEHLAKNIGNDIKNVIREIQCRVVQLFAGISERLAMNIERYANTTCPREQR